MKDEEDEEKNVANITAGFKDEHIDIKRRTGGKSPAIPVLIFTNMEQWSHVINHGFLISPSRNSEYIREQQCSSNSGECVNDSNVQCSNSSGNNNTNINNLPEGASVCRDSDKEYGGLPEGDSISGDDDCEYDATNTDVTGGSYLATEVLAVAPFLEQQIVKLKLKLKSSSDYVCSLLTSSQHNRTLYIVDEYLPTEYSTVLQNPHLDRYLKIAQAINRLKEEEEEGEEVGSEKEREEAMESEGILSP
jgi:hypothetical protein